MPGRSPDHEEKYDIIFSEPSNPYRAGIASLFTREFYGAVQKRLEPEGIFLQWVQAYEIDAQTVRTIFATISSVFPEVEIWQTQRGDMLLAACREPRAYSVKALLGRMRQEPYRSALQNVWQITDVEGLFAHYVAGPSLVRRIAAEEAGRLNTDDRTIVEFGFARGLLNRSAMDINDIRRAALIIGDANPKFSEGQLNGGRVVDQFFSASLVTGAPMAIPDDFSPEQRQRALAQQLFVANNDLRGVAEAWARQPDPPRSLTEVIVLGEGLAERGTPQRRTWQRFLESCTRWKDRRFWRGSGSGRAGQRRRALSWREPSRVPERSMAMAHPNDPRHGLGPGDRHIRSRISCRSSMPATGKSRVIFFMP